jgi:hypothetical protein
MSQNVPTFGVEAFNIFLRAELAKKVGITMAGPKPDTLCTGSIHANQTPTSRNS